MTAAGTTAARVATARMTAALMATALMTTALTACGSPSATTGAPTVTRTTTQAAELITTVSSTAAAETVFATELVTEVVATETSTAPEVVVTAPDPGAGITRVRANLGTITTNGYGPFVLGMTIAQAQAADPSMTLTSQSSCTSGGTGYATVLFNPDGRLSYIIPSEPVRTDRGLAPGDRATAAVALYGQDVFYDGGQSGRGLILTGPDIRLIATVRSDNPNPPEEREDELLEFLIIESFSLDGGQQCFG